MLETEDYNINTISFVSTSSNGFPSKTYMSGLKKKDGNILVKVRQLILCEKTTNANNFKVVKIFKDKHLIEFTHYFKQETIQSLNYFLPNIQPTNIGQ